MRSITDIGPHTKLCALIGNPVGHSMSPAIHNRAFAELGLDYVYVAFRVEDVAAAVAGMRALENFRGMSVTIPHKVSIIKHLDEVAAVDRGIGSVNTVVNDGGRLKGFGHDGPGAVEALRAAGVRVAGRNVTILGSGGAARAVAFSLAAIAKPASISLLGVIEPELKALTRDLVRKTGIKATGALLEPKTLAARLAESQVLIHCTPIGMHPKTKESVVPKSLLHRDLAVMDIVYNPLRTRLLADAEARGLKTISGVEMFVNQAVLQFELWTGKKAPRQVMRKVVIDHLSGEAMNLVLIGYRGTGKSTVAKLLADRLGMEVVSLDQEIVRQAGRSIPDIVAEHGWPHFRDLESAVSARVAARDGIIIDAGGGVILREENVRNLQRGGRLFWLRASVPVIVARIGGGTDRPALTEGKTFTEEVEDVLRERTPLYAAAADHIVETDACRPAEVAADVARLYGQQTPVGD